MSITSKIRLLALGLVLATATLIGAAVRWGYSELMADQQQENLRNKVEIEALRLRAAIAGVRHDVELLQNAPGVERYVRGEVERGDGPNPWTDLLASVFLSFPRKKPHYVQIRLVGFAGGPRELMRGDRVDDRIVLQPDEALDWLGDRPFIQAARRHGPGAVYFSRIDLYREDGRIVDPPRPTLRAAAVVPAPDGTPFGLAVINVAFDPFIDALYPPEQGRFRYYLANAQGDYLFHPDRSRTYGFERGARSRVGDEFPALAPIFDATDATDGMAETPTGWVYFRPVPALTGSPDDPLYLGIEAAYADVGEDTAAIVTRGLLITGALLVVALAAAWLLSTVLIRPLGRMTAAAHDIARHERPAALPTGRADEIGTLASAFQHMVEALADREEALEASNAQLRRANEDLQHFAHIASHDLREPARRVAGLADLVLFEEGDRVSPGGHDLLVRMQRIAETMLVQIADFRVLARIGHGTLARQVVRFDDLIDDMLAEFREPIAQRHVTIERAPAPALPVYEHLVRVLYRNLIDNALRHAQGDAITLRFTAEETADGVVLGVQNSGAHIPADRLEAIFAPFARLEGSVGGTGLGLSICRRIVERHAGRIWAESGRDTVHFKFTLGESADAL
ncbi:MAG: sensor histidine kinase [Myxococcales bacterium]|nr:sensor histidine kinase [Myxococcales bacterium]